MEHGRAKPLNAVGGTHVHSHNPYISKNKVNGRGSTKLFELRSTFVSQHTVHFDVNVKYKSIDKKRPVEKLQDYTYNCRKLALQ